MFSMDPGQTGVSVSTKQASARIRRGAGARRAPRLGRHPHRSVAGLNLNLNGTFRPGVGGCSATWATWRSTDTDFATVVDLESVKRVRVTAHLVAASVNVDDLIDSRLDLIDSGRTSTAATTRQRPTPRCGSGSPTTTGCGHLGGGPGSTIRTGRTPRVDGQRRGRGDMETPPALGLRRVRGPGL